MMGIIETLDVAVLRRRDEVTTAVADSFRASVRAILVSKDGSRAKIVDSCILLCSQRGHMQPAGSGLFFQPAGSGLFFCPRSSGRRRGKTRDEVA